MGAPSKAASVARTPTYILFCLLALVSLTSVFLYKLDRFAAHTKTVAGHNLEPTPWHLFPPKNFLEEARHARIYKIIQCSYLTCPYANDTFFKRRHSESSRPASKCPDFFSFIRRDLEPWARTMIKMDHIMAAKNFAAFRVVIFEGKLYLDLYYACVQSRMMFTIWGLLQLLNKYPGMVPNVDLMFDCMDKPTLSKTEHRDFPLPLFRYCTTENHFDIPFPDWSFWGWPEINIRSWEEEFRDIKKGSQGRSWARKWPRAYWKGNPNVVSPIREELLKCNHSRKWGAQIMRQDWGEEAKAGFERSKLANQCDYRYKIYAEGYAWSVSLKYIISCGSLALIISPQYEDFFSRGLVPRKHYWPVSPDKLCRSIKFAVDWGNANPSEAQAVGKAGQDFMKSLNLDTVYDYMFHLLTEYSKLQDFIPVPPPSALEVCPDSLLCLADQKQKEWLQKSISFPSPRPPCTLRPTDADFLKNWAQNKQRVIEDVREMEKLES
ncbi:hypothetical protein K2173_012293 [Erythroxylum novogranatense]|uniref:Glycosyl transferase CAP10 domain-containing protein n=1 Tax=Erythroxylum novogranatense TaxID=1862640 RepID=A0AAV8SC12_9ROSI|nr:hypothetical protein K2173_012293 [Erythroxylum novogranatense]